jgi:LmbE family N-acetylglucosaminyl deacetylase
MKETVMVIAAHADDEALGCGGTMARLAAEGAQIHVVFMADGVHSRKGSSQNHQKLRREAAEKAQKILGSERGHFLNLPDNQMDQVPFLTIVKKLEALIEKYKPKVIFTHFYGDLNVDHRITQQAVMTACRPLPGCPVKKIYGFEVPSSTEWATPGKAPFCPTFFVDIGPFVKKKIKALEAYSMEMREKPHARSIHHVETLVRHRGNSIGVEAAEAFVVYRLIQ